eukprot:TRINITY_DN151_c3_g1_i7.p3 TRINITY_DN151_c3_g1~~TRINITY_DN151_c3_g1_i7.p3  ORF type:complete len:122 (+),score=16.59 TRINITY_DN151_c3_g1_i7:291-656(+)
MRLSRSTQLALPHGVRCSRHGLCGGCLGFSESALLGTVSHRIFFSCFLFLVLPFLLLAYCFFYAICFLSFLFHLVSVSVSVSAFVSSLGLSLGLGLVGLRIRLSCSSSSLPSSLSSSLCSF